MKKKSFIIQVFQYEVELSEQEKNKIEQESGIRPVLPMPDLKSAPKMMVSVKLTKTEIIRQVEEQMEKISREMFESPESCTSKVDYSFFIIDT